MKKHFWKVFIATGMIVMSVFIGCSKPATQPTNPDAGKALLQVKVTPEDAVIIVDDVLLGNVFNYPFIKLDFGPHKIEIRKEGYEPFRTTVEGGAISELTVNLKKRE